jgi:hypothetical protein
MTQRVSLTMFRLISGWLGSMQAFIFSWNLNTAQIAGMIISCGL